MKNLLKMNKSEENKMANKKTMKFLGLPFPSTILRCHDPSLEISTTKGGYTLLPRAAMTTHIRVYAIHIDMWMDESRSRQQTGAIAYHGIRANNNSHPSSTINVTNDELHVAASQGDMVGVREAVRKNKELIWLMDSRGNLPLHVAVERRRKEAALYLIGEYPKGSYALNHSNKSPLYLAVVQRQMDLVENMLEHLAGDRKAIHSLRKGSSILYAAIDILNQEMVELVLKYQPKLINCTNDDGWNPLSCAAYNGHKGIVRYFLKNFPKLAKTPNGDFSYPVHKACLGGHVGVLEMFHARFPASFKMPDHEGRTILHLASKERGNKLKDVVAYLLSLHESAELVKKKDENERTPFDLAKSSKNYEVMELFPRSIGP